MSILANLISEKFRKEFLQPILHSKLDYCISLQIYNQKATINTIQEETNEIRNTIDKYFENNNKKLVKKEVISKPIFDKKEEQFLMEKVQFFIKKSMSNRQERNRMIIKISKYDFKISYEKQAVIE